MTGGSLIVFSGPSGSGKDTLAALLLKNRPDLKKTVSATTRTIRSGEVDGKDYYYLSEDEFLKLKDEGAFIETNKYNGNYYGTLKSEIDKKLSDGNNLLLVIDVNGAYALKKIYPDCLTIFNVPPSLDALRQRLVNRGTDDKKTIDGRIEIARRELELRSSFDRVVINDDLEKAFYDLSMIIDEYLKNKEETK